LPTSPTKALTRPKGKIAAVFLPGLRHHRTAPVFLSIFCQQDVYFKSHILAIMTAIITSSRPSDLNADEGLCRRIIFIDPAISIKEGAGLSRGWFIDPTRTAMGNLTA
jgi:hypothetical protein